MKKIFTLVVLLFTLNLFSQTVITCTNDSIKLKTKNYKFGNIEWEKSTDGIDWEKIENQFDTTFVFKPIKTSYYRAVNKLPSCTPIYSSKTLVQRVPVANAGGDRAINDNTLFLSANTELNSTGNWSVIEGINGTFDDNTKSDAKFTGESGNYKLLWKLENSCGFSTDTVSVEILKNTYYDKIVIIDETDKILSTEEEIENGDYKIEFSDPVPTIDTETILIGTTGLGYLRKVTTVSKADNTFTMETSQGKLDDILIDGGFDIGKIISLDTTLTSAKTGYKKLNKRPTRKEILSSKKLKTGVHYFLIEEKVKSLNNNVKLKRKIKQTEEKTELGFTLSGDLVDKNGIKVNLEGNLNFTPNLFANYNEKPLLPAFSFGLENAKLKNEFIFTLSGNFESSVENKFNLFNYIKVVYVLVGGVPVLLTTDIDFDGKVTADSKADLLFTHRFTNTITANAKISYKIANGWKREFSSSTVNSLDNNLDIKGSFIQNLEIGPKITFKVYGIVGPYADFKITQNFKLCAKSSDFTPFNWNGNFDIGTKITAGLEAKILKKTFDYSKTWERDGLYSLKFPYQLDYFLGNNQQYIKGEPLANMPEVRVTNNKGNPVQFVPVKFEIEENSSDIVSEEYVLTNIDGYARTNWTPNTDNSSRLKVSVVDCDDQNISNSPYIFNATELQEANCSETTLSASYKIEDNILTPIAHRGVAPYTFSTDNITFSSEKPEITLVDGQTYTLYIKDNNGCVASKSYISTPFSCDDSDLDMEISTYGNNIDIKALGGKPPYEYSTVELPGAGFKSLGNSNSNNFTSTTTFYNLSLGEHQITIKDANGCEKSSTVNLETTNTDLNAYFEYTNNNGLVTFKNLSNNAISYKWDFGDGDVSTIFNPKHSFKEKRSYTINLTVGNDNGETKSYSQEININEFIDANTQTLDYYTGLGVVFETDNNINNPTFSLNGLNMYAISNSKVIRYKFNKKYEFQENSTHNEELETSENGRSKNAKEVVINSDGTKLFVKVSFVSFGSDLILQYNLPTPYSLNNAELVDQFEVFYAYAGLEISSDDKTIYLMSNKGRDIVGYRFKDIDKVSTLEVNSDYTLSSIGAPYKHPYTIAKSGNSLLYNPIPNHSTVRLLKRYEIAEKWKLKPLKYLSNSESEIELDNSNKIIHYYDDLERILFFSSSENNKFQLYKYKI